MEANTERILFKQQKNVTILKYLGGDIVKQQIEPLLVMLTSHLTVLSQLLASCFQLNVLQMHLTRQWTVTPPGHLDGVSCSYPQSGPSLTLQSFLSKATKRRSLCVSLFSLFLYLVNKSMKRSANLFTQKNCWPKRNSCTRIHLKFIALYLS